MGNHATTSAADPAARYVSANRLIATRRSPSRCYQPYIVSRRVNSYARAGARTTAMMIIAAMSTAPATRTLSPMHVRLPNIFHRSWRSAASIARSMAVRLIGRSSPVR